MRSVTNIIFYAPGAVYRFRQSGLDAIIRLDAVF